MKSELEIQGMIEAIKIGQERMVKDLSGKEVTNQSLSESRSKFARYGLMMDLLNWTLDQNKHSGLDIELDDLRWRRSLVENT